jgi:GntR family transcriptional regulator of arabinose operon
MNQIGRHLVRAQRACPCFLSRPGHTATTDLRVAGCRTGLQAAGTAVDQDWHVSGEPSDVDVVQAVLAERSPDVIVCANDLTAALLIQSLARLRCTVPDDLAVVGFDDVVYSTLLSVSLTTMHQPFDAIARTALRAMVERVADPGTDPRQLLLTARLVVRESSPEPPAVG